MLSVTSLSGGRGHGRILPNMLLTCYSDRKLVMAHLTSVVKTYFIVLLVLLGIVLIEIPLGVRLVQASTRSLNLLGFVPAWNSSTNANPPLRFLQGDIITLTAKAGDGQPHQWFLDVDNNGVADCSPGPDICSASFTTNDAPPITFTVATASAPYTITYYCAVHPGSMHGTFTALSLTNAGGARYAE